MESPRESDIPVRQGCVASRSKSYDISFKLAAVQMAERTSKSAAARRYKVDAKRVREWCHQKEALVRMVNEGKPKRRRLEGAGRKPFDRDMEEELFQWIMDLRSQNHRVSRRMIMDYARTLASAEEFRASRGWLEKFMERKGLSLRRRTTVCQRKPADHIPKIVNFVMKVRRLRIQHHFELDSIFAMDETSSWFDMLSNTTVDRIGQRSVPLKSTGHEKQHFTVVLSSKADGTKLKPYIVFKGKGTRLLKQLNAVQGVVVRFSSTGWMNDELTIDYLQTQIGQLFFSKRLLIWDAYRCHISDAVQAKVRQMKLHTAVVPGGCTGLIQAADVVWNASFKHHMRCHYDEWLANPDLHEFTRSGNLKHPSRTVLCEWVKLSWNAVSDETIRKSFLSCAITGATDGSEDDRIHCFKEGQPCEGGLVILNERMKSMAISTEDNDDSDSDPFEDEDETEANEAVIDDCIDDFATDDVN